MKLQELVDHAKKNDPALLEALKTARTPEAFVTAARVLGYEVTPDAPRGRAPELLTEAELMRVSGGQLPRTRTTASWTFGVSCCWC
jgi:predicted ribosomally synthesized peptide with nif11-like leader